MAWFKVDDRLWGHPKWIGLNSRARALWVTAGSWSSCNLTDGKIPQSLLKLLGGTRGDAAALVEAGLWDVLPDGWVFHDWAEYQPSRASIEEKRLATAERVAKWRNRKTAERKAL